MEIYSFLDIAKKGKQISPSLERFVVEECADYDSALEDYVIVCHEESLEQLKAWIVDNCKKIGKHACRNIDSEKYAHALSIVKSACRIPSFTEKYVMDAGSIQGFLDKYGNTQEVLSTAVVQESSNDAVADVMASQAEETADEEPESASSSEIVFRDDEDEDFLSELNIEVPIDAVESYKVFDPSKEEADPEEELPEGGSVKIPEYGEVEEEMAEKEIEVEVEPVEVESELELEPAEVYEGVHLPLSDGGDVILPYRDLLKVAGIIRNAAAELEQSEVPETDLLTERDKEETLKFLDDFSPSMFKRFVLDYVSSAESDLDYCRVTKMLDAFCEFVDKYRAEIREVTK